MKFLRQTTERTKEEKSAKSNLQKNTSITIKLSDINRKTQLYHKQCLAKRSIVIRYDYIAHVML